jgi:hypothetical protein
MRRNQGDHLKWNEVKAGIIEFIIRSDGAIPEPEIRKFLARKYEIKNLGTLKKHLKDLQYRPYSCIVKIQGKSGLANKWDIKKIEHLKNIRIHFPEMRLNGYKKSLNIIIVERSFNSKTPNANRFRIQLLISVSFFDMCLKSEIETLYSKADEIRKFSRNASIWRSLGSAKNKTNKLYTEFMKRILTNPNIWLDVYNECINDSLKSKICQTSLKFSADIEISEEAFQKMVEEAMIIQNDEISPERLYTAMIKEISTRMSCEIIGQKMFKELRLELLETPTKTLVEQLANMLAKMSEKIFNRILVKENWEEIYHEILQIISVKNINQLIGLEIIFDHYFQRDIVDDTVSTVEKKFVLEERKYLERVITEMDKNLTSAVIDYNNFLNDFFEKYRDKNQDPIKILSHENYI